jgi:4a-hydroxytetrahydrobiopterin dehydratase
MKLTKNQILYELKTLSDWKLKNNTIEKQFELANFKKAIEFTNQVADAAEKADHHPDILIHNWNKVTIVLTTHSEGGLTQADISLAKEITQIYLKQ